MPSFDSRIISDYVVVDLETTGLSPENDKIIEIAAVKVINDTVTDTFSTLVDPTGTLTATSPRLRALMTVW